MAKEQRTGTERENEGAAKRAESERMKKNVPQQAKRRGLNEHLIEGEYLTICVIYIRLELRIGGLLIYIRGKEQKSF